MYKIKRQIQIFLLITYLIVIPVSAQTTGVYSQKVYWPGNIKYSITNEYYTQNNSQEELIIHFINVGQADSTLIELPERRYMLIDAGNNNDGDKIIKYLRDLNIEEIDYIIGTHPHEDHIGGLDQVIDNFDIGKIYLPEVTHTTKTFEDLLIAIRNKGKKIIAARSGVNILSEDNLEIFFLSPDQDNYQELNHHSAVIKMGYYDQSFLFTGDAEKINEEEMMKNYRESLASNILKVAHHGSNSSTTEAFLDSVNPKYAVISVGRDNRYGHPVPAVLERLELRNINIYRTDLHGTIIASSDGYNISFNIESQSIQDSEHESENIIRIILDIINKILK
ncbi:MAG: ComEC/Rec2 family competence protein [Halanaerobiales bacterium]